jgi:metal-responsive CopG/Arc/MetJ family transcriptional regulator
MPTTIKTAISIQKSLFEQAEILAQQLNVSRSHLFSLAMETFVKNHQNQRLLDEINQSLSDEPDPGEKVRFSKIRNQHRNLLQNEW